MYVTLDRGGGWAVRGPFSIPPAGFERRSRLKSGPNSRTTLTPSKRLLIADHPVKQGTTPAEHRRTGTHRLRMTAGTFGATTYGPIRIGISTGDDPRLGMITAG